VDSRVTPKSVSRSRIVYRGPPPDCAEFQTLRFAPLPGSAAEISEIDRLWLKTAPRGAAAREASLILTGAAASESAFKQKAADYRIVHLATHGFFLLDQCESTPSSRTAVAASTSGSHSAGSHQPPDSPLLLSGLAFAGANRRQEAGMDSDVEDGILTSEEIASLSLPGVEWLVLSGCDTGAGRVLTGEGVLGLRRAFQVAGARTLIMSLWRVEDASATEWMRRLYEARGKGQSTAEAMRQASLGVLQARRAKGKSTHPYFWGPFIAAGDWR
jgi:CHAT domain-containing protein